MATTRAIKAARTDNFTALCDMDLHLIGSVVEIAAGIPDGSRRLSPSLRVGGSGEDAVVAGLGFPVVGPETPCVAGAIVAEGRGIPVRAAIGGDFDLDDVGLTGPRGAVNCDSARGQTRAVERAGDHRLHTESGDGMSVFRLHRFAGLAGLVGKAVSGAHEVA